MRALLAILAAAAAAGPAPSITEIVRTSIERDQSNWMRMKDYTWIAHETTRRLDSSGKIVSTDSETWETTVLFGEPYRKLIERDGRPLPAAERAREQEKIDRVTRKLERESPAEQQRRLADYVQRREKDREFLREIPDAFEFTLAGSEKIDGRDTWVIAARPKPGYRAKHSDAKAFAKIEGKIWIDQRDFQWVRVRAKTIATISAGLFLARLEPGATVEFDQTRINDEVWLPSREQLAGSGRVVLLKKLSEQQETTWTKYRKFEVDSKVVSVQ